MVRGWKEMMIRGEGGGSSEGLSLSNAVLFFCAVIVTLSVISAVIFSCAGGASKDEASNSHAEAYSSTCVAGCGAACGG
ncbi:hypothetical protein Pint_22087 [Pistacia integerrima]|uniref:Uncharacterized protein n=1 Tax=Pistacia integerrima TaxID=434235 RepID=A0ACC0YLR7_9ROSI|nr:hypothetical protein Pint_22087 [Pistacia integerrima]